MNFKKVFLLWLLADFFIGLGTAVLAHYNHYFSSGDLRDPEGMLLVSVIGLLFSLPSLVVLMIFHAVYSRKTTTSQSLIGYLIAVLCINALYALVFIVAISGGRGSESELMMMILFFCLTTIAGVVSLFIVYRKKEAIDYLDKSFLSTVNQHSEVSTLEQMKLN